MLRKLVPACAQVTLTMVSQHRPSRKPASPASHRVQSSHWPLPHLFSIPPRASQHAPLLAFTPFLQRHPGMPHSSTFLHSSKGVPACPTHCHFSILPRASRHTPLSSAGRAGAKHRVGWRPTGHLWPFGIHLHVKHVNSKLFISYLCFVCMCGCAQASVNGREGDHMRWVVHIQVCACVHVEVRGQF